MGTHQSWGQAHHRGRCAQNDVVDFMAMQQHAGLAPMIAYMLPSLF
jgi:hypothetical protein